MPVKGKLTSALKTKKPKHWILLSSLQTPDLFEMIEKMQVRW